MLLFVDCYDSFSYNLVRLLERESGQDVCVVHNDAAGAAALAACLPAFDAVVVGPGPGDPAVAADAGLIPALLARLDAAPAPLLGICFGFQSLVLQYGGRVERMHPPVHGQVSEIDVCAPSALFRDVPARFDAVRYHSLCSAGASALTVTARAGGVDMAVEHPQLPFYAVQFHPESVLSTYGDTLVRNFCALAAAYNARTARVRPGVAVPRALREQYVPLAPRPVGGPAGAATVHVERVANVPADAARRVAAVLGRGQADPQREFVCLQSRAHPGQWTIFGNLDADTLHVRSKNGQVFCGPLGRDEPVAEPNVFAEVARRMQPRLLDAAAAARYAHLPFVGGFVGYITYEGACQHTTNQGACTESGMHSDVSLVLVTEAVLLDEAAQEMHVVGDRAWCAAFLRDFGAAAAPPARDAPVVATETRTVAYAEYAAQYDACMQRLLAGDSYELCLTAPATVRLSSANTYDAFKQLASRNPAPYCSYLAFDDVLLATSPERFVAFDASRCEFRPIKGTVRKRPGLTRAQAAAILQTPKEQAENLMIVDLIRHDLQHLLANVRTPQLMRVEEYHSVYQLVTSIEGDFDPAGGVGGLDVLVASLPPGSMTGAPKKRSVEILRAVEPAPRGVYSGVHGYWSVHGRGDWSVVIRSLFRARDADAHEYTLGAGGGVTVLSTCQGEFDEMHAKLDAVLAAFRP